MIEIKYLEQKQDSTCVAVAIVNACRYLGVNEPDLDYLVSALCCRGGAAIGTKRVIKQIFDDRIVNCSDFHYFSRTGGILTIMHPIMNLHALLCYPEGAGFTLINSWLGPNVLKNIGHEEIAHFLPRFKHQCESWKFCSAVV